ncbi:hypothetical protein FMO003_26130 [Moritella sp. F3]|nr:hypothetical protein FMO001_19400 [Moritella sp. F1]GIC82332.1 hypothetical protein FMO003_26130 [Moritella sp. F3]
MRSKLKAIPLVIAMVISGCSLYTQPDKTYEMAKENLTEATDLRNQLPAYKNIEINSGIYIEAISSSEANRESWYFEKEDINFRQTQFDIVLQNVFAETNINFKYIDGIDRTRLISVNHDGTLGESLKIIGDAAGYSFTLNANTVTWSKYETQTFDLAMFPGIETFGVGKGGGNVDYNSDTSVTGSSIISSVDEFVHTSGELDVYQDLRKSIPLLLSKEGKFELNPATTSLLVKDFPTNVSKVKKYIGDQNEMLTRQVAVDLTVIDVQFDDETSLGLDWDLVIKNLGQHAVDVSMGSGFTTGAGTLGGVAPMIIDSTVGSGKFTGTQMLISALQSQGSVSKKTYPRTISLNNRVTKLRSIQRTNYIREQTTTNTINVGSESSIEQGTVSSGFSMYLLPKIYREDVIMRLTTNISTLISIEKKGTTGEEASSGSQVYIESPTVADKDFDQSIIIRSGRTLLIAGLSTVVTQSSNQNAGHDALGMKKTSSKQRVETIIAITPTILRGVRG